MYNRTTYYNNDTLTHITQHVMLRSSTTQCDMTSERNATHCNIAAGACRRQCRPRYTYVYFMFIIISIMMMMNIIISIINIILIIVIIIIIVLQLSVFSIMNDWLPVISLDPQSTNYGISIHGRIMIIQTIQYTTINMRVLLSLGCSVMRILFLFFFLLLYMYSI